MSNPNSPPFPVIIDSNGNPLTSGFVYIGLPNVDSSANQVQCYYDFALTEEVAQPIRIVNGLPVRGITTCSIYVDSDDYSVEVLNSSGASLYNITSALNRSGLVEFPVIWTADGSPPSLGNGSLKGSYSLSGNTVHLNIELIAESLTTFGTGVWAFKLPFKAADSSFTGSCVLLDAGTAWVSGFSYIYSPRNLFDVLPAVAGGLGGITGTSPFVWAAGDKLLLSITYFKE